MRPVITFSAAGLLLLSACGPSRKVRSIHKQTDTVHISATNNPMDLYRESAPQQWRILHTRVALSFDYAERTAAGEEWVSLQPYFYATDSLWLDAKSMKIASVTIGQEDKPLQYTYEKDRLRISLGRMYTAAETVKLNIRYTAMPYAAATGGSSAISDDRGLYFINADQKIPGKPVQIWTQGETESNSHWLPTIDKPNSRTTIQLELTVPEQYKTLSNGTLLSSEAKKGKLRKDIWRMDQPIQVYAIMFAIGDFTVIEDKWKNKQVNYYVEKEYAPYARNIFKHTPEMIGFFSDITGVAYPWNKYSQIVVRDYVSGAMENTSASLFGEFVNQNNREMADKDFEDVVSHELFHQWFGDYVTAESWSNLTVNESFANYGEYLWRKHKYGTVNADELAWEDLDKYLRSTSTNDPVLVRHYYLDKEDMFDRISYQKGGATLHYLHTLIGDTAFYKAMNSYLSHNALKAAEATHWRLAVEDATGRDWNWFFNEWYYRAGHPVLEIQYSNDDARKVLQVKVTQVQPATTGLYHLPLKCLVIAGTRTYSADWQINAKTQVYEYPYNDGKAPVIVPDIQHVLPGEIREQKSYAQWLQQLQHTDDYMSKRNAVAAIAEKELNDPVAVQLLQLAITDRIAAIREKAVYKISEIGNQEQQGKWQRDIAGLAANDGNNTVRAAAFYVLGLWKVTAEQAAMKAAINDSSYKVAGNALYALNRVNVDSAYTIALDHINDKPATHLDYNAWSVITGKALAKDTALLQRYAARNQDGKRDYLIRYISSYATNTDNEKACNAAVVLMGAMIGNVEHKSTRAYYAGSLNTVDEYLAKNKKSFTGSRTLLRRVVQELKSKEAEEDVLKVYNNILSSK